MNVLLEEIKNDVHGAALLYDWLGDKAEAVTPEQTSRRALACLRGNDGSECPHHVAPRWWETAKTAGAEVIRGQLELKHKLKMATPFDDDMKICRLCGCCMSLKIFAPINHIAAHTPHELLEKYPAYCWQRKELESL